MKTLLDMTASASVLIVCTVILRALFIHRLPKQTFTALWLIAALRLLVPFSVDLPVSVPVPQAIRQAVYAAMETDGAEASFTAVTENTARTAAALSPSQAKATADIALPAAVGTDAITGTSRASLDAGRLATLLWGSGAVISLGVFLLRHERSKRRYREAVPVSSPAIDGIIRRAGCRRTVRARVCQTLATPLTFGLFQPVILLPKALDMNSTDRLDYILTHELVHIKKLHVLYKYILTLAVCVHWFNPLAWLMYALANRDLELSCDQAVLRLSKGDRRGYALTLIAMEETRGLSPLFSGFGASAVEERIRSIMKFKKTGIISIVLAVVLVLGATTVFAAYEAQETKPAQDASASAQTDGPIQYICQPVYYTAEEFKAAMADEKASIEAEVAAGTLERESADTMLETIDGWIQEAEDGAQFQCPAPVYYADGSPVVNSKGEQLYVKASDIEQCNQELLYRYNNPSEATTAEEDAVTEAALPGAGGAPDWESNTYLTSVLDAAEDADGFHWYTYEEYAQYVQEMKAACKEMEGQWAFDAIRGWYEWTAEDTAQSVATMEQILVGIQNGMDVGVTADGGIMLASYDAGYDTAYEAAHGQVAIADDAAYAVDTVYGTAVEQEYDSSYIEADTAADTATTAMENGAEWDGQELADYFNFGISLDTKNKYYLYDGKPLAGFVDKGHYTMTDGWAEKAGGVYVAAERSLLGKLTGVHEVSLEEFCELTGLSV